MLPDYLNSFDPLKQRLTGKNSSADQQKIKTALQQILGGKAGGPEFGMVSGSAEEKALRMVGGNTGRFAGNYIIKNYDKLDPMVKEMVGSINPKMGSYGSPDAFAENFKAGSDEEKARMEAVKADPLQRPFSETPKSVRLAVERKAKAKQPKASFMENIGFQEGGMVPVDGEGNVPPEAVAGDVVNGAPMGMVDVPNGGGPVDDGVPTELPEGTVVINAAAIRLHGTETIDKLINDAVNELLSEGVQISMEDPNPEDDVPVAISNGEYVIPPEVAEKIGYKKLEDMNERGRAYLQKQQAQEKQQAEAQQPSQPSQQPPESFMGAPMPPEQAGPPQAPVQSEQQAMAMMGMMGGGRVPYAEGTAAVPAPKVGLIETLQNFMSQFGSNVSDMLGGKVEPTAEGFPKGLKGTISPSEPPQYEPARQKNPDRGLSFKSAVDPMYDSTLSELGPTTQFRPNVQRRAQGGFVGEYNYAQPQQATMGTPFPNAVDSSPQQSQSFLRPNDAKKNFRVGLADGTTSPPPVPKDNPRRRPTAKFKFSHWLEDFNADKNITDEEIAAARERFDRFNVDKIPDNVFSDVDMAVQKAGIVFEGDSGFSKEKIENMVRHTGFVETEYGKTIANTNEQDDKKARSHYQIEPKTAYSLVNPARSGALLGKKFNQEFNYLVPEGLNKTAKEYLNNLYTTDNKKFLDILQNDKYLGATLAAGRYIQVHQQRQKKATGGFISP